MRAGLLPPRSDDVLPFETLEAPRVAPATPSPAQPPFPFYIEPLPEEALVSWALRLAARLGVSLHLLASQAFGINDPLGGSRWWCRPQQWLLERISAKTGLSATRLWKMSLGPLQPAYREDEASGRFGGRRYDPKAQKPWDYRFAVCYTCLAADTKPHLRSAWLLGWMAVCPVHGTRLIDRCGKPLCLMPCTAGAAFFSSICNRRRRASIYAGPRAIAHPAVVRLQASLLEGKRAGTVRLEGLGELAWPEIVVLADALIGTVWTGLRTVNKLRLWSRFTHRLQRDPRYGRHLYDCRHDSLLFLAWLLEGWPHSEGATVGRGLLKRWLSARRSSIRYANSELHSPEPHIRRRLQLLLEPRPATPKLVTSNNFGG